MAKLARGRAAASPSGSNSASSSFLGSASSSTSGSRSRSRSRSFSSGSASDSSKDRKPPRKKRFHAPEIVLALEHLHSLEIVYRDTGKPENALIQASFHAMLTDFNLCVSLEVDHSWNQLARGSDIPQESNGGWHRR